jgi:PD-(D/E)XK nuclease superfamily
MSDREITFLSYSKIDKATLCPLQFKFKYIDGIPEKASGTMHGGSVVHAVIEFALNQVILGTGLPSAQDLDDLYPKKWAELVAEEENKKDFIGWDWDDPESVMFPECRALVKLAREEVLPKLKPKFVEHEINFDLESPAGPFRVNGYIDLVEEGGFITDWKTSTKVSDRQRKMGLQMPCYAEWAVGAMHLPDDAVVKTRKLFLIRGRKPHVAEVILNVKPRHRQWFRETASAVWLMVKGGGYPPNPNSWMCSPNWCPYYEGCLGGGE